MDDTREIRDILAEIQGRCNAGFAVALHVHYTTPRFLFQTYEPAWAKVYSERGLVLRDPTVRWGLENEGMIDWSALEHDDPAGVLKLAREHGIHYGFTHAIADGGSRSVGSFARKDTDFSEEDREVLSSMFLQLHRGTHVADGEEDAIAEMLRKLSVELTHTWK
ncbi:autoinducer binding domain-containing protein [Tropicimonas sediminicola]|uniref:LuxR family transcriptional regulator n=1 Tax=Tropicimonas sediminicola TaxID=1031541 RepID=A0A239KH10_9RHOB|nr:autoinducer binding domain-containing protein [Tropicimonas sediminicola]SNT16982.1 LuxR family transcriptional regulator [Tropicimonas sediminicola]